MINVIRMDACFIINSKYMDNYDVWFKKIRIKTEE